jgi:hypothetical protein
VSSGAVDGALELGGGGSSRSRDRYSVRIAGISVGVVSADPFLRLSIAETSRAFLAAGEPELHLNVLRRPFDSHPEGALRFDSGATWRLFETPDQWIYRFFDARRPTEPYKELHLQRGGEVGTIVLHPDFFPVGEPIDPLEFPLDELLFLRLLSLHGGVELHACGVLAESGVGYLFVGQSGDGKTTTARLWQASGQATVLSDDRIIVRRASDGAWRMYGTPWHGEALLAANVEAPLAAIFVLARGECPALRPMAPVAAVSALLARSFTLFHDADAMATTVALLEGLVESVPCRRFEFAARADAVTFVQEHAA